jgi:hypothetical protein
MARSADDLLETTTRALAPAPVAHPFVPLWNVARHVLGRAAVRPSTPPRQTSFLGDQATAAVRTALDAGPPNTNSAHA